MPKKKILIIDDDRTFVMLIGRSITQAGYEVISAFDGVQALRLAFNENPDLIILDIRFPAGGGIETLKKLNTSSKTWNIPIIISTSYDDPEVKRKVEEYDIAGFMLKPVDPEKILLKIQNIIGK